MKQRFSPIAVVLLLLCLCLTVSCGRTDPPAETTTAHVHEYIDHQLPATCTAQGCITHTCHLCGDTYIDSYTDPLGHTYEAKVTPPSCAAEGFTTHTCTVCGDSYTDSPTEKTAHSYIPEVIAPTCSAEGYTKYYCYLCHDTYTDSPTAKVPHQYITETVAPTGTEEGYDLHTCAVCGDSYRDNPTPPLNRDVIVNFDPAGGVMSVNPTQFYRTGSHVDLPIPTREGHVFEGWYLDEETRVESGVWSFTQMTRLTARWSPIRVEIVWTMDVGGTVLPWGRQTAVWGEPLGELPEPTPAFGYLFDGWYEGNTRLTAETVSAYTEKVTFTARFLAPLETGRVTPEKTAAFDWAIDAEGLLTFRFDANVTSFAIPAETFRGNGNVRAVAFPRRVELTDLGRYAFADCTALQEISVPGEANVIRSSVFEGCTSLTHVTLGSGISVLNEDAFRGCGALTTVTFPLSLYQIYSPFGGCDALSEVRYEGDAFQWSVIVKDPNAAAALSAEGLKYTYEIGDYKE
ncbi:MAG: leucine-rich repeat protein [Clostridia bacterium]|nr:leucine-rich repeat protein [Clostridia bacterium]